MTDADVASVDGAALIRLEAHTAARIEQLGGKACGLLRLLRAGLRVPEAWCVPADVPLDADLARALRALHRARQRAHPGERYAVRSSAVAEDLAESSFAGVYTTVLGVDSEDALIEAVGAVRAAFASEAARAYRARRGMAHNTGMAVVVQRLLAPDVSGVLMTENPRRPFADERVIDAVYGLGEGVVSGRVEPDHLVLSREGALLEESLGEKSLALRYVPGQGAVYQPTAPEARDVRCLDAPALDALVQLARDVDARIAPRSDVEWAMESGVLYALQQRPMTALPPRAPRSVSARQFGDEYLAGYGLPLTRTFLVRWIRDVVFHDMARLMGRADLLAMEPIEVHQGYHYMRGEYAIELLRSAPAFARALGPFTWFSPDFQRRIREARFDPRAMVGFVLAPFRDRGALVHQNLAELARHCARVESMLAPRLAQDYTALSPHAWETQLAEVDALGREHFRVIRWGMAVYAPALHALLQHTLRAWCDDEGALYQAIVGGLSGTRTAEINRDVHALSLVARAAGLQSQAFRAALDAFLARHGHRAPSREITDPRWREAPDVVIALVRAQLAHADTHATPEALERDAIARRDEAERAVFARVRDPLRSTALRALLRYTREYTRYRENQRYHLDYVLTHCRSLMLEQGRRLRERAVLAHPDEVFLLEVDELRALARGEPAPDTLRATLDARRAHWHTHRARLPASFLFDGVETEGEIAEGPRTHAQRAEDSAQGASRGRARGPARIAHDVHALSEVRAGDILVVSTIDPAWTSVFPLLAGLVTETGGTLSHGALLAREYGIPAVAGVKHATQRFAAGAVLDIDGTAGTVRVVEG